MARERVPILAALYDFSPSALYQKVRRARTDIPEDVRALEGWAQHASQLIVAHGRAAPIPYEILFFGKTKITSARSFERLVEVLSSARRTVSLYVYSFTSKRLAETLVSLAGGGVVVRVLVCRTRANERASKVRFLKAGGVLVEPVAARVSNGISHHKYAVLDNQTVLDGSFNWTVAATLHNREHISLHKSRDMAAEFGDHFNAAYTEAVAANKQNE